MIDSATFLDTWEKLCQRFGRSLDSGEAQLYLTFLRNTDLDTESFLEAARALWATREFFPRPADFLLCRIARGWQSVQRAILTHSPPQRTGWAHLEDPRARAAVGELGGLDALKELYQRDPALARREFFDAYELRVLEESAAIPLLEVPEELAPDTLALAE